MAQETKDHGIGIASQPGPEAMRVDAWLAAERARLRPEFLAALVRELTNRGDRS